ncbi:MAG: hypothetical protein NC132_04970 [Corallococcus sp.]|nr:hypothetical protein [Corallococcus sp.]MCM1359740.1 hypothetical protein [Corallococcus sp.]MCM1395449.1 hypothetical protein [Corallococcus sp.]
MLDKFICLLSSNGFAIGLGVEIAVAAVAAILLVLLLANVFAKRERSVSSEGKQTSLVTVEGEPVAAVADEVPVHVIREINTVYVPVNMGEEKVAEPVLDPEPEPVAVAEEEPVKAEEKPTQQPIIINVYNTNGANSDEPKKEEESPAPVATVSEQATEQKSDGGTIHFKENKTIEELYAELSAEQKSFFDELKQKALQKPQAVLSITRNYENVKIGKKSILKLLVRKGVTVAEFSLENDLLKEYRKNTANQKGKAKIRVRPTVIAVTELATLKTALDMIDIAHEQILEY